MLEPISNYSKKETPLLDRLALASFLCGVMGVVLLCSCMAFTASVFLGVAAISLARLSRQDGRYPRYARLGLFLGIISTIFGFIECAYLIFISGIIKDPEYAPLLNDVMNQYQELLNQATQGA